MMNGTAMFRQVLIFAHGVLQDRIKQRFNIYYMDDAFYIRPANTKTLVVDMGAGEPYNVACYNLLKECWTAEIQV